MFQTPDDYKQEANPKSESCCPANYVFICKVIEKVVLIPQNSKQVLFVRSVMLSSMLRLTVIINRSNILNDFNQLKSG